MVKVYKEGKTKRPDWATRSGPATEAEKERIAELADMGWSMRRTALELNRHPSFVLYYYCKLGYRPIVVTKPRADYFRRGYLVRGFTPQEDELLRRLSTDGKSTADISRAIKDEFGYIRKHNALQARLYQIAATEQGDD